MTRAVAALIETKVPRVRDELIDWAWPRAWNREPNMLIQPIVCPAGSRTVYRLGRTSIARYPQRSNTSGLNSRLGSGVDIEQ